MAKSKRFALGVLALVLIGGPLATLLPESERREHAGDVSPDIRLSDISGVDLSLPTHRKKIVYRPRENSFSAPTYSDTWNTWEIAETNIFCKGSDWIVADAWGVRSSDVSYSEILRNKGFCADLNAMITASQKVPAAAGLKKMQEMRFDTSRGIVLNESGEEICRVRSRDGVAPVGAMDLDTYLSYGPECAAFREIESAAR